MKPFLKEKVVGDKVQFGAVMSLGVFLFMFYLWGMSARPLLGNVKGFFVGYPTPTPKNQIKASAGSSGADVGLAIVSSRLETATPVTITSTPTQNTEPTQIPQRIEDVRYIVVTATPEPTETKNAVAIMSNYYPPWGGINCNDNCNDIATGESWVGYVGQIVACPTEFPIGTVFHIEGRDYECRDRGGAIITEPDGRIWLDILTPVSKYYYKQEVPITYTLP